MNASASSASPKSPHADGGSAHARCRRSQARTLFACASLSKCFRKFPMLMPAPPLPPGFHPGEVPLEQPGTRHRINRSLCPLSDTFGFPANAWPAG